MTLGVAIILLVGVSWACIYHPAWMTNHYWHYLKWWD